jgi:DNA-binding XRE family transcriptional regulator
MNGDGKPKVHRFRSHLLELGPRLKAFRQEHDLTQAELAPVLGVRQPSTLCQWEKGAAVPRGAPRDRLIDLLDGKLLVELRQAMVQGTGMPDRWIRAVRWYRRASRERVMRQSVGLEVAEIVEQLWRIDSTDGLRWSYCHDDGAWSKQAAGEGMLDTDQHGDVSRARDVAYGLRWLEIRTGAQVDLTRSLMCQVASDGMRE